VIALRAERTFDAPREAVFAAWTNPEVLRRWWASEPGWRSPSAEVDLRVGGRYRLSMGEPDGGPVHAVTGEYTEVRPPERLAYTWAWEGDPPEMDGSAGTLVTVEFTEDDGRTTVTVVHTGFATEQARDLHRGGWGGCLDSLGRRVFPDDEGAQAP
jgi:uncharacterized protein YndB with AHSA1/START domain